MSKTAELFTELSNIIDANQGRIEICHNAPDYWSVEVELEDDSNYALGGGKTLSKAIKSAYKILVTEENVEGEEGEWLGRKLRRHRPFRSSTKSLTWRRYCYNVVICDTHGRRKYLTTRSK